MAVNGNTIPYGSKTLIKPTLKTQMLVPSTKLQQQKLPLYSRPHSKVFQKFSIKYCQNEVVTLALPASLLLNTLACS